MRYYLYDGHGSVRHLADENGAVTDTYDYDAFGNLTEQTGDTENSYLYCGEQYDANTGFYYLRARYMNPGTGTFISMDSYQGSMFDPVSIHKYLYANANPVMYTDPTGYFSLADLQITQKINAVLSKIATPNVMWMLNKANKIATIYDTVSQINDMLKEADGSAIEVVMAFGRGIITGLFINKMCAIKQLGPIISKLSIGYGIVTQVISIFDAVEEGDWKAVAFRTIQLIADVISLGQSCFTGDTLVATEDGQKRIDEIQLGDKVWAYNVETGETELKTVTKIYVHEVDEILHLYTTEGQIDTTTNHPFYVVDKGWVAAGDLEIGDEVYQLDGTTAVVVGSVVEKLHESILVYNLEVEDLHSYFVGDEPVLVHNYNKKDNTPDGNGTPDGNSIGEDVPWSSGTVSDAANQLQNGANSVNVNSRSQAEELFMGLFQGDGYRNTTGMDAMDTKNLFGGKGNTYHWDDIFGTDGYLLGHGAGNSDALTPHLQIHPQKGSIIRIFFDI